MLGDFGSAAIIYEDEVLFEHIGSPGYTAPEIFLEDGYDTKSDIFSIGCLFYFILTG